MSKKLLIALFSLSLLAQDEELSAEDKMKALELQNTELQGQILGLNKEIENQKNQNETLATKLEGLEEDLKECIEEKDKRPNLDDHSPLFRKRLEMMLQKSRANQADTENKF